MSVRVGGGWVRIRAPLGATISCGLPADRGCGAPAGAARRGLSAPFPAPPSGAFIRVGSGRGVRRPPNPPQRGG